MIRNLVFFRFTFQRNMVSRTDMKPLSIIKLLFCFTIPHGLFPNWRNHSGLVFRKNTNHSNFSNLFYMATESKNNEHQNPLQIGNMTASQNNSFKMELSRFYHTNVIWCNVTKLCHFLFCFHITRVILSHDREYSFFEVKWYDIRTRRHVELLCFSVYWEIKMEKSLFRQTHTLCYVWTLSYFNIFPIS